MQREVGHVEDVLHVRGFGPAGVDEVVAAPDPVVDAAEAEAAGRLQLVLRTRAGEEEEKGEEDACSEKRGRHGEGRDGFAGHLRWGVGAVCF